MLNSVVKNNVIEYFSKMASSIENNSSYMVVGKISHVSGLKIEAEGLSVPINSYCEIHSEHRKILAEVIGFSNNITYLMAAENTEGIKRGSLVVPFLKKRTAKVGRELLGRIIDSNGIPIDGRGAIAAENEYPLHPQPVNPLLRKKISESLNVGIRAINGLFTVGKGQRVGIFAGTGVGKSVLLGMMTRFTSADVVVVGLIGERGREVKEFIEENLGEAGLKKSVVVSSPSDTSPLMRVNGAILAMTIAEYFRDLGLDVLLIVDSLTRFAQSHREIALSVGELPTTKGFTSSVFAKISQLVERSGNGMQNQGSITAFYTVLVEGFEINDPVAEHVQSVLDGHIFLSRELAGAGHYPAIDVNKSISRVMPAVVSASQLNSANQFKKIYSAYLQNRDLINVGMYQPGSDRVVDESIQYKDKFEQYLVQGMTQSIDLNDSVQQLTGIFANRVQQ